MTRHASTKRCAEKAVRKHPTKPHPAGKKAEAQSHANTGRHCALPARVRAASRAEHGGSPIATPSQPHGTLRSASRGQNSYPARDRQRSRRVNIKTDQAGRPRRKTRDRQAGRVPPLLPRRRESNTLQASQRDPEVATTYAKGRKNWSPAASRSAPHRRRRPTAESNCRAEPRSVPQRRRSPPDRPNPGPATRYLVTAISRWPIQRTSTDL